MKKAIILLCFSAFFLTSCTNSAKTENVKEEVSVETKNNDLAIVSHEVEPTQSTTDSATVNRYDSYSGEWINWNNPENEADGGVSLIITIKNNKVTGNFSAWSKNYGRLADSDISGNIQENVCRISFTDDGRGHSGTILLTFGQEQIIADISVQIQDTDFTFPLGTTVLTVKKDQSAFKPVPTEESSISSTDAVSSDNDMEILFRENEESASSVKLTYGMNYNDVAHLLISIGEKITESPWEEYSNYTLINNRELWPSINTDEDFNQWADLQKTLINTEKQYTFTFITQNDSLILTSILIGTPVMRTTKNIKCGDSVNFLTTQYGTGYNLYTSAQYEIYEYKTSSGYVRFFIDPKTKLVAEWEIDIYSYQEHLDMKNKLERIFSE